ncbi:hypothetical protein ACWEHA_37155 [Amycolatopsis nivea]
MLGGLFETVAAQRGLGRKIVPIASPDEIPGAGALPMVHDRCGSSANAAADRVREELSAAPS